MKGMWWHFRCITKITFNFLHFENNVVPLHSMKRLTEKQSRHSLTTQVVMWVVGFVSVLFVTALFIMFYYARQSIYQEAMEKARQTLRTTELRIDNVLNEVETATRSLHWTIEKRLNRPEIMDSLCRQLLRENPHI